MIVKTISAFMVCVALVGCASSPYDKASASHIVRVVEGKVVSVRVQQPTNKPEVNGDAAMLTAQVQNMNNSSTLGALLVLDVLLDLADDKPKKKIYYKPTDFYTILDEKTKEQVEVSSENMYAFGVQKAEEGDHLRALYAKAKRWNIYNLTKNPELDEKTR